MVFNVDLMVIKEIYFIMIFIHSVLLVVSFYGKEGNSRMDETDLQQTVEVRKQRAVKRS